MTKEVRPSEHLTRRAWLVSSGLAAAGATLLSRPGWAAQAPTAPVALARCISYGSQQVIATLRKMFDQIGGLGRLVKGKTVAIKLNLTGDPDNRAGYLPIGNTTWVHPDVVGATVHLLGLAGATRIRLLESPWRSADPVEELMISAGWEPRDFVNAAARVEFENTNFLGRGKQYFRFKVPQGGLLFPAFDLNHSYEECDVFVSIAKLKEHQTTGVTLSMKNCFGITPCTIYGDGAGEDEPGLLPRGGRNPIHSGDRQPSMSSPPEIDPSSPRNQGYRVPRCVADLVAARPIHLAIVDGIEAITGGEVGGTLKFHVRPGILLAGINCVTVDAVGTAVMGLDPMAERGSPPFERCDSTLRLAEQLGVGTRDLKRIEVVGERIADLMFDYRKSRGGGWPNAPRPA
ncbi:MAG: DUF362 domain-containing protein [Acidobacteriales bacterium]|nr:MAG: DUF362 domain-containing protein [Terriglobales bacterium]